MEYLLLQTAIEAQFLMGHCAPSPHTDGDRRTITDWSWDVDDVRQALHVPANALWDQRILELEAQRLATFCMYTAPVTYDEHWNATEIPGWRDQPREQWGSLSLHPGGVLKLATLYGRPYVKFEESPAVLAHWQLVQGESDARLHMPYDEAQWAREWPEQTVLFKARQAAYERPLEGGNGA